MRCYDLSSLNFGCKINVGARMCHSSIDWGFKLIVKE